MTEYNTLPRQCREQPLARFPAVDLLLHFCCTTHSSCHLYPLTLLLLFLRRVLTPAVYTYIPEPYHSHPAHSHSQTTQAAQPWTRHHHHRSQRATSDSQHCYPRPWQGTERPTRPPADPHTHASQCRSTCIRRWFSGTLRRSSHSSSPRTESCRARRGDALRIPRRRCLSLWRSLWDRGRIRPRRDPWWVRRVRMEITLSHRGCTITSWRAAKLVERRRPLASSTQISSRVVKNSRSESAMRGELRVKGRRRRSMESIMALSRSDEIVDRRREIE